MAWRVVGSGASMPRPVLAFQISFRQTTNTTGKVDNSLEQVTRTHEIHRRSRNRHPHGGESYSSLLTLLLVAIAVGFGGHGVVCLSSIWEPRHASVSAEYEQRRDGRTQSRRTSSADRRWTTDTQKTAVIAASCGPTRPRYTLTRTTMTGQPSTPTKRVRGRVLGYSGSVRSI